jgi:hypothetical protein
MKQLRLWGRWTASGSLLGIVLGLVGGGAALSSGCEKKTETDPKGENDNRASELGGGSKVPADWPEDVAIYPGAKVRMNKSNPSQQLLFVETPDAEEAVLAFYQSKLAPMKPRITKNDKQQSVLSYQDAAGRRVMLSIGKQTGGGPKTLIAMIVNRPPAPANGSN